MTPLPLIPTFRMAMQFLRFELRRVLRPRAMLSSLWTWSSIFLMWWLMLNTGQIKGKDREQLQLVAAPNLRPALVAAAEDIDMTLVFSESVPSAPDQPVLSLAGSPRALFATLTLPPLREDEPTEKEYRHRARQLIHALRLRALGVESGVKRSKHLPFVLVWMGMLGIQYSIGVMVSATRWSHLMTAKTLLPEVLRSSPDKQVLAAWWVSRLCVVVMRSIPFALGLAVLFQLPVESVAVALIGVPVAAATIWRSYDAVEIRLHTKNPFVAGFGSLFLHYCGFFLSLLILMLILMLVTIPQLGYLYALIPLGGPWLVVASEQVLTGSLLAWLAVTQLLWALVIGRASISRMLNTDLNA